MKIRQFIVILFMILLLGSIYINTRYLNGMEVQRTTNPIKDYIITKINYNHLTSANRLHSNIDIYYNNKKYYIDISDSLCLNLKKDVTMMPKLYYIMDRDEIFTEDYYNNYPIIYATYIISVIIPLILFIVYRKELDNHYSTM